MSTKSYKEKLRSPKWQKKRLEILSRDNFTCVLCGDTETELHVNHLKYKDEPFDTPNEDLETLCKHCHYLYHSVELKPIKAVKFKFNDFIAILFNDSNNSNSCIIDGNKIIFGLSFKYNSEVLQKLIELNTKL